MNRSLIVGLAAISAILLVSATYALAVSPNNVAIYNKWATVTDCTYLIFTDGITTYAKNCDTGAIDYSGIDAATIINNAIASSDDSTLIFIKQGSYTINSSINLKHGLTLAGESPGQSVTGGDYGTHLKLGDNADVDLLVYNGANLAYFLTIRDMFLEGNRANNVAGSGIYLNNKMNDILIDNVYIDGFSEYGMEFDNAWNYRIFGVTSEHHDLDGLFAKDGNDLKVIGSKFLSNERYGFSIGSVGVSLLEAQFIGNYVYGNKQFGGVITDSPTGIYIGNVFEDNSNGNPNTYDALRFNNDCDRTKIIGNTFIGSSDTRYAVAIASANSQNIIIEGNSIQTMANAAIILDSGTGTIIRNNAGYVTENEGTAIINNGLTNANVTHGLSYTPTAAECTVIFTEDPTTDPTFWWISNISSTQFRIDVNVDPGASNLDFSWACRRI